MTPDAQAIRERLRCEIKRVGWTAVAERCEMNRANLHRAFRAGGSRSAPSFVTVSKVAAALGLKLELTDG